jgi:UDP-N-acetylglucosamine--N-acetylmuramyl-(pentapeptide) pyrophosphoryl-undecaprenol N-acetylglucosamine transferase
MSRSPHIVVMAGGTGGHVFPALAVARALEQRGATISWIGTARGLEAELVPAHGYELDLIGISGLRGKGLAGWLVAPVRVARAISQALGIIRRRRADAVLGMGGFVTGPGGVAARLLRRPLIVHEQNALAGLTNRLLARIASRVLEAFPGALPGAEHTGNPVRPEISAIAAPADRYRGRTGPLRLLVIGGSQGALALNEGVPRALSALAPEHRPQVRHQSGRRHEEATCRSYREAGVDAEVLPFLNNMSEAYAWADLVICRSGALTVSELAAAGVPSVLVPFPHAVDDHQTVNGRFLSDAQAAVLLPQPELDSRLTDILNEFCADPEAGRNRLQQMAEAARALARPEATEVVAEVCLEMAGGTEV